MTSAMWHAQWALLMTVCEWHDHGSSSYSRDMIVELQR